jgi:nucleotide-binding universal stress UspA family protein
MRDLSLEETVGSGIQIKRILLPTDGSPASLRAARYAVKIAKQEIAEIMCIHAIAKLPYPSDFGRLSEIAETFYFETKKLAEKWFFTIKIIAAKEGVKVKTDVIIDVTSASEAIVQYAEKERVDLVVMGTRGRTGLKMFLMGSTANGVVLYAHCPVLVVR